MRLNAPRKIVFYIAAALMLAGIVVFFLMDDKRDIAFWVETAGGVLLALSVMLKGL